MNVDNLKLYGSFVLDQEEEQVLPSMEDLALALAQTLQNIQFFKRGLELQEMGNITFVRMG